MLHSSSLPPFEGEYRVYIIDEAGRMSVDAANRLLKTLEEPVGKIVFMLLTNSIRLLPATVVSRCQRLNLSRVKTVEVEAALITRWQLDPERAKFLARLSQGCPGWAIEANGNLDLLQERKDRCEKIIAIVRGDYSERFAVAGQLALQFGKKREIVCNIGNVARLVA
jgi:DNA polymerase-3 subunit delta'